jgi:hypothetical protein
MDFFGTIFFVELVHPKVPRLHIMKSKRGKAKLIVDEGGPSQIGLTFVTELEKNLGKKAHELN